MNAGAAIIIQDGPPGEFTLDTAMLAERFGWSAAEFHDLMRRQRVTSLVERGTDDDHGSWRLSVRCGNRQWQAIVSWTAQSSTRRWISSPRRNRALPS
ncbi:MAG TPA: DUF6522 family protein [Rhizobiaceae bacterium]|nr:DUF6522 family protein [Rhizobiaceae bacterium]